MITFQRAIQVISLFIFLFLLAFALSSITTLMSLDFFLLLDPALIALTAISSRTLAISLIPALIVIAVTIFFGRIFCGYFCPMGTTLDGCDKLLQRSGKKPAKAEDLRLVKYILLVFLFGASLAGVSFVFITAPLSLITRFYGLLVHPVLAFTSNEALFLMRSLAELLGTDTLSFFNIVTPRFATQLFILVFFGTLVFLAKISPRFWCRYLCPSGALMALVSKKPMIRRCVSADCTDCGDCADACPMAAIMEKDPHITRHEECIVCKACVNACPVNAISFIPVKTDALPEKQPFFLTRRQFVWSGVLGAGTAVVNLTGINSLYGKPGPGQVAFKGLVRPPAALPEMDFLSRCVRCGECMAACPTNTLQPIWFDAGFMGLFSPALTPRRSYCNPECHMCANVCPTHAIQKVSPSERIWAKTGTAVINRQKCIAWEHQKSCMVCDEVCPFKAVQFRKEPGNPVPVPQVMEDKCAGCGYCEHYCPVQNQSAIVVTPMGALRLSGESYEAQGKFQGLTLSIKAKPGHGFEPGGETPGKGFAPGFEIEKPGSLPP